MLKISQLSNESWLIETYDTQIIYLLSKAYEEYILTGNGIKCAFSSIEEVEYYFNQSILQNIKDNNISIINKNSYIRGYLIDYDSPVEVFAPTNGIPIFKKHEHSDIEYAAGYYAIKRGRFSYVLCPKLSTLREYYHVGPFKTKEAAVKHIRKLRKDGKL
jgi:hypothetical protein